MPDAGYLAYAANPSEGVHELSVLQADGSVRPLDVQGGMAYWSPNGRWLAYRTRYQGEGRDISIIAVETGSWASKVVGLTYPCQCDYGLELLWSTDSRWVVSVVGDRRATAPAGGDWVPPPIALGSGVRGDRPYR